MSPELLQQLELCRADAEGIVVLPPFDELVLGYADRSATLSHERAPAVFPTSNGRALGTVLMRGEVVATWRPRPRPSKEVAVDALEPLRPAVLDEAVRTAIQLYAAARSASGL